MKNYNLKNPDGVVTEQDGLQIGFVLERIALNHNVSNTELFSLSFTHKCRSLLWKQSFKDRSTISNTHTSVHAKMQFVLFM